MLVIFESKITMFFGQLSIIFIFLMSSCYNSLPHLEGVDKELWKKDRSACKGMRSSMIGAIDKQQEKFKTLTETQIVALLGRPDQSELFARKKKSYVYYLNPGPQCKNMSDLPKKLIIRFDAIGLAKEVFIEMMSRPQQK